VRLLTNKLAKSSAYQPSKWSRNPIGIFNPPYTSGVLMQQLNITPNDD
jgi:hypothetical protein